MGGGGKGEDLNLNSVILAGLGEGSEHIDDKSPDFGLFFVQLVREVVPLGLFFFIKIRSVLGPILEFLVRIFLIGGTANILCQKDKTD